MPNPLTGDFEAVLQISGNTINRLLATMHQNDGAHPNLPSFPHNLSMRIGDGHAIDGVKGYVQAQVSVPRVELIHGVTDRFILEVGVRAWYRPDPGTTPLPSFIHGTVRAEYRIQDIDPACFGWKGRAADYLWLRVVKDSVRFRGSVADEDRGSLSVVGAMQAADEAAAIAKITKQIASLLAIRFKAAPHRLVNNRFKRGSMRSLNAPNSTSAVAIPIGLSSDDPIGDISGVFNSLLDGADLAVGVSVGYVMSVVEATLAPLASFTQTIPIHVETTFKDFDTVYHVGVTKPVVTWQPSGSWANFNIKVHGSATTESVLPNAIFDIDQNVTMNFDSGSGQLWLAPGSLKVTVHVSGLGHAEIANMVSPRVSAEVKSQVALACSQAQPELDAMTARTQVLIEQLRTLDAKADAQINQAQFVADGIVLRGDIFLSSRRAPVVQSKKTAQEDGHTAFESWIPGGRIDSFEWSWTWSSAATPPGKATRDDRFLLRRPKAQTGRWGMGVNLTTPLPGIDGWGLVCLRIKGVRVDATTGQLVPVESVKRCTRFGLNISDRLKNDHRLLLRDVPDLVQDVPFPELALVRAGGAHDARTAANTLLVYADQTWNSETALALRRGLQRCGRYDAGLALLVLFRDGRLADEGQRLLAEIEHFASEIGIAAFVNEDVRGAWSQALGMRSGSGSPGWRLIAPDGGVSWAHDGPLSAEALTAALDTHLQLSPDHAPVEFHSGGRLELGKQVTAITLDPAWFEEVESDCPPIPLGQLGLGDSIVSFVQQGSAASMAQLRTLFSRHGQAEHREGPALVVVVDGADAREVEALKRESGIDVIAVPDPSGAIADHFGVGIWPTTLTIDRVGRIFAIETGVSARRDDAEAGD